MFYPLPSNPSQKDWEDTGKKPLLKDLAKWIISIHDSDYRGHKLIKLLDLKTFRAKALRDARRDGYINMKHKTELDPKKIKW